MYRIYALENELTKEIFYIGQSKQKYICKRKSNHIEHARKNIRSLKKNIYIRACDYKIELKVLEEFEGTLEKAYEREQFYIDFYKPCCNISNAKPIPPKMAGHNKINLPENIIEKLGKKPDYVLAKELGICKNVIANKRKSLNITSYAEQTENNGRHKKGTAKGTIKGFYTKIKPEFIQLLGTMPDKNLAELAKVGHGCIFKKRKSLNIKSFGNNHGRNKKNI